MTIRTHLFCALTLAAAPAAAQDRTLDETAPVADFDDGDGVRLAEDACPATPPGLSPVARGCAAVELVRDPSPLLRDVLDGALELRDSVAGERVFGEVERALNDGLTALTAADDAVRVGDACGATFAMREGVERLYAGGEAAAQAELWLRAGISATRPRVRGATEDGQEIEAARAAMRASALRTLAERAAREGMDGLQRLCDASVRSERLRGVVESVDPVTGLATLAGLRAVAMGDRLPDGAGVPGIEMDYEITQFGDGSAVVVYAGGFVPLPPDVMQLPCAYLQVEPVEPHQPFVNHPVTLHDIGNYFWSMGDDDGDGKVVLEKGMRLGYGHIECDEAPDDRGLYQRQFHRITVSYLSKYDDQPRTRVLAAAIVAGDTPVPLPEDAATTAGVTLTSETYFQSCWSPFDCDTTKELESKRDIQLADRGGLCMAVYEDDGFAALPPGGFHVTRVATVKAPSFVSWNREFTAKGRRVWGGVPNSVPTALGVGDDFAIGNPDIFDPNGFLQSELYGVDHAAGLVWPRIRGKVVDWQYSCRLPALSTDELADCPEQGSMAYKLPFDAADAQWTLSQGNNGSFTHNGGQYYAFDFVASAGTDILAARGGEVVWVREDQTGNSYADPDCEGCAANAVQIRHVDGTYGTYFHMPTNGVTVTAGQKIERGAVLGQVGNTGYSTGPHVHFHVTDTPWSETTPVAFEVRQPVWGQKGWTPGAVQQCVVPPSDSKVFSTNVRP